MSPLSGLTAFRTLPTKPPPGASVAAVHRTPTYRTHPPRPQETGPRLHSAKCRHFPNSATDVQLIGEPCRYSRE